MKKLLNSQGLLLFLTLAAALAGALLRRYQLANELLSDGTLVPGSKIHIVLIVLLVLYAAAVIALLYWFFGTEYGCALRATGANVNMARAQGINTGRAKVVGLMLSNGLVALSGALLTQYQGYADVSMGRGAIVIGLAAVIIGEVLFGKIFHNFATKLIAVSIGAIIYYIVMQVVLWLGLPTNYLKLLTALVVAMFLAVPHWKSQLFTARSARKGGKQDA